MKRNWQDIAEFICGIWLCASPFILGFTHMKGVAIAVVALGAIILLFGELGYFLPALFEEGITLIVGIALIALPWVLGFDAQLVPAANAVVLGLLLVAIAVVARIRDTQVAGGERKLAH